MQLNRKNLRQLLIFDCQAKSRRGSQAIDLDILARLRLIYPVAVMGGRLPKIPVLPYAGYYYRASDVEGNAVSRSITASQRLLLPLLVGDWQLQFSPGKPISLVRLRPVDKCRILVETGTRQTTELLLCRMFLLALIRDLADQLAPTAN